MRKIRIVRFGNTEPIELKNSDKYDSYAEIILPDGRIDRVFPFINTDFTNGYKGGILAEGIYGGVVGKHKGSKAINVFDFNDIDKVDDAEDLTEKNRTLPSLIYNPNNKNETIKYINIHRGGEKWDYSHGCITVYPLFWTEFIGLWNPKEKMVIELVRREGITAPDFYQGK